MEKEEVMELDLKKVWQVIKKNFIWFILICLLCGGVAYTYTKLLVTPLYKSTAKIIVVKDSDASNEKITSSDITLAQKLKDSYKEIIKSDRVANNVIKTLNLNITSTNYRNMVSLPETSSDQVIDIAVTSSNPELAQKMANQIVKVFQTEAYSIMHVNNVDILNEAQLPKQPSSPNYATNVMIGVIVGIVICAIIVIAKVLTDTKVKTAEEVKEIFNLPIIGTIPEFEIKTNEVGGNKNVNA